MAATPKTGIFKFATRSGSKTVSVYISDVAAAKATFSQNGTAGTGSDSYIRFDEPVILVDYSMTTGTADTKNIVLTSNGAIVPGSLLDYVAHVSTNSDRPRLNIGFKPGSLIGAIQNA